MRCAARNRAYNKNTQGETATARKYAPGETTSTRRKSIAWLEIPTISGDAPKTGYLEK